MKGMGTFHDKYFFFGQHHGSKEKPPPTKHKNHLRNRIEPGTSGIPVQCVASWQSRQQNIWIEISLVNGFNAMHVNMNKTKFVYNTFSISVIF